MKHLFLTIIVFFSALTASAQEIVNVTFTAKTETGLYCPFSSISATNVTRGWTEILDYPDTILVLTNTVGLEEHKNQAFHLGDAYPNPFTGETCVFLELPEKGDVLVQVIRVDGSESIFQKLCLDAGTWRLTVNLSTPQLAFLSVATAYGRQVARLVHTGYGLTNALDVDYVSTATKSLGKSGSTRLDATGGFEPGDVMRYEAQLIDGTTTLYSNAVIQPQYSDELVTLFFTLLRPTVMTNDVTEITQNSAICGGNVTDDGGLAVIERGVCWSTMQNPTVNDSHTSDGTGSGNFTSHLTDLSSGTPYYVRAYAINRLGLSYGNEVNFTTMQQQYSITVFSNPSNGGTVSGGGTYSYGQTCSVMAIANNGYTFVNWTENGTPVSTNSNYTFTVTGNRTLVANFTIPSYAISVSANPSNGGTVTGGGSYNYGQSCTVSASASTGYIFVNWTENGNVIHTNACYTFTVADDRTLVANFTANPLWPDGTLPGYFSVSATQQVQFSQGNLQYIGNSQIWKFADHQWDCIGYGQGSTSSTVDRDLFGWGTSGWHDTGDPYNVNYQPWSTSGFYDTVNMSYNRYGYGPSTNMPSPNLTGSSANYDWGVFNPISGAGGQAGLWRTLTNEEWIYLFNMRSTSSGKRYAKAQITNANGCESMNGIILLPDDWNTSYYPLYNTDQGNAGYSSNVISANDWNNNLEPHGAVFLPAAGLRGEASVDMVGEIGDYWSTSYANQDNSYNLTFNNSNFYYDCAVSRYAGRSVRLVRSVQK